MMARAASAGEPRVRHVGILLPSSNTVVEAEAPKLIPADGSVVLHYSRFRVTVISESSASQAQFEQQKMLDAASLLADAKVDCIAWAGTAASWLGFDRDQELCDSIRATTSTPAMTSVLAINAQLKALGARRIGLVTPYVAGLENSIKRNYAAIGIETVASERLGLTTNTDYAAVTRQQIAQMCRSTARSKPSAIVVMCTNLRAAAVAESLSREIGIPVVDSVATTIRYAIQEAIHPH
jgi:maleate isomerase